MSTIKASLMSGLSESSFMRFSIKNIHSWTKVCQIRKDWNLVWCNITMGVLSYSFQRQTYCKKKCQCWSKKCWQQKIKKESLGNRCNGKLLLIPLSEELQLAFYNFKICLESMSTLFTCFPWWFAISRKIFKRIRMFSIKRT